LKLLVVEDFDAVRRFICSVLQRAEFFIAEASDGLEAVQKAEELQPDLILLDIGLPSLNGLEVARCVRRVAPAATILFLSVSSDPDLIQEALNLGARGYVHKPRVHGDLLPAIEAALGGQRFVSSSLNFSEDTDVEIPHHHEIVFCSGDEPLLDSLTRFIAAALNGGNAAIVWATESHRDSLLQRLRAHGTDVHAAIQRGTYIASAVEEAPDLGRMLDAVRGLSNAASKAGKKQPRVAVCGERAGRLWAEGKTDMAIRLEQLLNELAKYCDVDILCPYSLPHGRDADDAFSRICEEHSAVSYR
jgi:DNA-binding NarL/FixJ family response regulator